MTSFLHHKEVSQLLPPRNPAEEAPLAGCKEAGRLLLRPLITRTKPSRLGLAQGGGIVRRGWLSVFSTLAIGFVCLAAPSRAQFAYVTNESGNNVSAYSIGANGALTPVPGSPFAAGFGPKSVAITPLVPFSSFASSYAKLEIAKQGFDLKESFTLGANSNGINPVTENVTLQIGTFSVTIPPGSFKQIPHGRFTFEGVINGVSLEVQIVPLGNNIFIFKAEGRGVDLTGLTNPVTVVLTIGNDTGSTAAVIAQKNEREKRDDGRAKQEREDQETGDEEGTSSPMVK